LRLSFLLGLILAIIGLLIGLIFNDWNLALKVNGFIVAGCVVLSGILNGSFISGDQFRANYLTETKDNRDNKMKISKYLLSISLPNIIVCTILFVVK